MRWSAWAAAVLAVATSAEAQAQARYAEPGAYGGGLIEFLVTGQPGAPRRAAAPTAYAHAAPQVVRPGPMLNAGDPVPVQAATAPERYAALPRQGMRAEPAADPYGAAPDDGRIARTLDPRFSRQEVAFTGSQRPGTIVIDTPAKFLYLVQPGNRALRYGIGVGRPGFAWSGSKTVSRKAEWPGWTPPPEMLVRRPDLPRHMEGGPDNPLGARALYLGSSLYRIHGTNEPHTIGQSVSSGCIRMMNADVVDLYERVPVGTRVDVL